jgi:hypothetical protein
MFKFVFFFILFLLLGSYLLHSGTNLPSFFSLLGSIPGDMVFSPFDFKIYCPFSSAALSSFFCTIFFVLVS